MSAGSANVGPNSIEPVPFSIGEARIITRHLRPQPLLDVL
jgi:hypothetical protein